MNCGKAAREGALGCDLGTPFVNSSAPAEPQGRTHPPQWASSEQPPQAALSESECSPTSRMILRCPGAHCAPLRDNVASGNISFNSLYRLISLSNNLFFPSDLARACRDWLVQSHNRTATRVPTRPVVDSLPLRRNPRWLKRATGTFLRADAPFMARACRDWLVQSHNRTATRLPTRPVVDSLCCGKATPVETCHWHVSKSRLSNPFHLTPKKNRYSFEYRFFWWKVVDSNHRSHRRQIYSLFPLATRETFHIRLPA